MTAVLLDFRLGCRLLLTAGILLRIMMRMKTTVVIEDGLYREVRRRAAEEGVSFSRFLNRSLREALKERAPPASKPFRMITYGAGGRQVAHEPADFYRLLEG